MLIGKYTEYTLAGQLMRIAKEHFDKASDEDEKHIWLEVVIEGLNRLQALGGEGNRSTHATSLAMWEVGEGIVSKRNLFRQLSAFMTYLTDLLSTR